MNLGLDFNNTEEVIKKIESIKDRFNTSMLKINEAFSTAQEDTALEWFDRIKEEWDTNGRQHVEGAKSGMDGMVEDVKLVISTAQDVSQGVA